MLREKFHTIEEVMNIRGYRGHGLCGCCDLENVFPQRGTPRGG